MPGIVHPLAMLAVPRTPHFTAITHLLPDNAGGLYYRHKFRIGIIQFISFYSFQSFLNGKPVCSSLFCLYYINYDKLKQESYDKFTEKSAV